MITLLKGYDNGIQVPQEEIEALWGRTSFVNTEVASIDYLSHTSYSDIFAKTNNLDPRNCYILCGTYFYRNAEGWHASNYEMTRVFDIKIDDR